MKVVSVTYLLSIVRIICAAFCIVALVMYFTSPHILAVRAFGASWLALPLQIVACGFNMVIEPSPELSQFMLLLLADWIVACFTFGVVSSHIWIKLFVEPIFQAVVIKWYGAAVMGAGVLGSIGAFFDMLLAVKLN